MRRNFRYFIALLLVAVGFSSATLVLAQKSVALPKVTPEKVGLSSSRLIHVDSLINKSIKDHEIPGAVLAVVKDGKIAYLKSYGNRQVVPDTVPMTTNTIFDLASISKCVGTTLSIMQLVEKGKIRLTDYVSYYIPGFKPWIDPETKKETHIRIVDLLSHSSGIQAYVTMPTYLKKYGEATPDSLIKHIGQELPLLYKPTTGYTYSCLNFVTLQHILQNVTGMPLDEYTQKNIFGALGLRHTSYLPTEKGKRERALAAVASDFLSLVAPTEVQADGLPILGEVHDPIARVINQGNSGNAGVFSNAEDLAVIAAAIMNGGEINGRRILSPMTIETMITNPKENHPSVERALGWDNYKTGAGTKGDLFVSHKAVCHTGYTGTSIVIDMDTKCAVILLTNRVHPKDDKNVARLRSLVATVVAASIIK